MADLRTIVVTGASGFIAKHVIAQLLELGFAVRGTLRSQAKIPQVRQSISQMVSKPAFQRFSLFTCDLLNDAGWAEAMLGADGVMHVATVVPMKEPRDRDEVIRPAIEGTQRVLRFAHGAGISRIIMTSSIAAIGYGVKNDKGTVRFTEADWTSVEGLRGTWAYPEGKVRSEILAWEMAKRDGIKLTTVCPSVVFGPAVDADTSASLEIVRRVLAGKVPAMPPGGMGVVDVRDVANIHVAAFLNPTSAGRRVIACAQYMEFAAIAGLLGSNYPEVKVPTRTAPKWLLRFLGRFDRTVRQIAADIDTVRLYDGSYGAELMGRDYRTPEEATISAAESLYELGIVKHPSRKR
ncbi:MAG TPA: NAD-dependent epimerase/dehydratase family protein [Devosia sp.]|nr:NAD-dependent epimerase/dehydratase family protein [Devosia sp.]